MESVYIYKTDTGYIGSFKKREKEEVVDIANSAKEAEKKIVHLLKMDKLQTNK